MKVSVCRLEFHRYGVSALTNFTGEVSNGIYSHANVFATPPILLEDLQTIEASFRTAAAEYTQFGITKKVAFQEARIALMDALDQLAAYVDKIAAGNISTISLSGFVPTSDVLQPASPLDIINSFNVSPSGVPGQIIVDIPAYAGQNNVTYTCICVEGAPLLNPELKNGQLVIHADDPTMYQDCTKGRRKMYSGLKSGGKYFVYVFACNSVSVSPLSEPKGIYVL